MFRQMQELTNDYYSEIKIHNIFHIAYKATEFNKKRTNNYIPDPNIGTTTRQPLIMAANGGFVHKANDGASIQFFFKCSPF